MRSIWVLWLLFLTCLAACVNPGNDTNQKNVAGWPAELGEYHLLSSAYSETRTERGPLRVKFIRYVSDDPERVVQLATYGYFENETEAHDFMKEALMAEFEIGLEIGASFDQVTGNQPAQLHWIMTKYESQGEPPLKHAIAMTTSLSKGQFVTMVSYVPAFSERLEDLGRFWNALTDYLSNQRLTLSSGEIGAYLRMG